MPLLRKWNPDGQSAAAVWRIEEPAAFFQEATGLEPDGIRSEKRRTEWLAGRFLLRHLAQDFPLGDILPDAHDKPRISADRYHFSISHSFPFAAAVVSTRCACGIDIQKPHPRIGVLADKFLSPAEKAFFSNGAEELLLAWAIKEAAYKWQGRRGVDFIRHLPVLQREQIENQYVAVVECRLEKPFRSLRVQSWSEDEYGLALAID